jgi:hypothetical protein
MPLPVAVDNTDVWKTLDSLSNCDVHHEFIRSFSSLPPAHLDFITHKASALRHNVPCQIDRSKFSSGGFNISFLLIFQDDTRWILRIRVPNPSQPLTAPDMPSGSVAQMLPSSIDTMRHVKARTTIPIPEVYIYDVTGNNALGAAFIVMEYLDGVPIPYHPDLSYELLEHKLLKQICRIAYQLYSLRFTSIGGIYASPAGTLIIGPKFANDGKVIKLFSTAKEYYIALTNDYWNTAASTLLATL